MSTTDTKLSGVEYQELIADLNQIYNLAKIRSDKLKLKKANSSLEMLNKKIIASGKTVELEINDWMQWLHFKCSLDGATKLKFKIDLDSLIKVNNDVITHNIKHFLGDGLLKGNFDVSDIMYWLGLCIEHQKISPEHRDYQHINNLYGESRILEEKKKCMMLETIVEKTNCSKQQLEHHKLNSAQIFKIKTLHTKLQNLARTYLHKKVNCISLELIESQKHIKKEQLLYLANDFFAKKLDLLPTLQIELNSIKSKYTDVLSNNWDYINERDKFLMKIIIQKDLPILINSYLSLPQNLRQRATISSSEILVGDVLRQSLIIISDNLEQISKGARNCLDRLIKPKK